MKQLGILLLMILLAAVGSGIAVATWYSGFDLQLDPREAYCRGYVEGRSQMAATAEDEAFCLQQIKDGLDFQEIGLKGPLLPG